MEPTISTESIAIIKTLLYEEVAIAQERGMRDEMNAALDAINEFNQFIDRKVVGIGRF